MGILDEFANSINREINKVQSRSQEMFQGLALTSQIRTLERRKAALFVEVGHLAFDKYQKGAEISEEAFRSKTREIADCNHEIEVLQAELQAIQAQYSPDASASTRSEAKAGFRPTPGAQCPHCQAPADLSKSFCPSCGGSLADARQGQKKSGAEDTNGEGI
jgi:hypothetical protein